MQFKVCIYLYLNYFYLARPPNPLDGQVLTKNWNKWKLTEIIDLLSKEIIAYLWENLKKCCIKNKSFNLLFCVTWCIIQLLHSLDFFFWIWFWSEKGFILCQYGKTKNLQHVFHTNCDELPNINKHFFKQILLTTLLQIPGLQWKC